MANTSGEKELKTDWPTDTGLEDDKKHEGRQIALVPEESIVPKKEKVGLNE